MGLEKVFSAVIGVLDYGVGNVQAILNCYKSVFVSAISVDDERQIPDCSHLILPGVGSFDYAMQAFNRSGLREATTEHALHKKKPFSRYLCWNANASQQFSGRR